MEEQLELARIDAGALRMHLADVDLGALAEQAIAPRRPLARERGITLEAAVPPGGAGVHALADAPRIEQVILILVDNAIAHTLRGGHVTVSVGSAGGTAQFTVSDTGEGIPAADQAMVFDRFYRRDGARGRPGTGLGLAIARGIVDAHGGDIVLVSAPGSGSAFTVSLPTPPVPGR